MLASLDKPIDKLDAALKRAADEHPQARLLMTQPGVGPISSLAFVLTLGDVSHFRRGKQVASYLGLIPRERSSGGKQRLGAINKQGNSFMRTLLVESARTVTRLDDGFRKQYYTAAIACRKVLRRWPRRAGWQYDSTGCCVPTWHIRRSFASRVARAWPWSAKARPRN